MAKIFVRETELRLVKIHNEDYICLTDMLSAKDGQFFVSDWMRNRNTLEFLGIWETVNNPTFNYGEFAIVNLDIAIKLGNSKLLLPISRSQIVTLNFFPQLHWGHFGCRSQSELR
ncbi:MAG: KilA-N domain-containing protein [Flavobacteriales bacterium]|jgi:hypothetical protein